MSKNPVFLRVHELHELHETFLAPDDVATFFLRGSVASAEIMNDSKKTNFLAYPMHGRTEFKRRSGDRRPPPASA